jgi:hypothetical protein
MVTDAPVGSAEWASVVKVEGLLMREIYPVYAGSTHYPLSERKFAQRLTALLKVKAAQLPYKVDVSPRERAYPVRFGPNNLHTP